MEEDFINYPGKSTLRIADISVIEKSNDIEANHYYITFGFNKEIYGGEIGLDCWRFSVENERDKVYHRILELINTNIINLNQ